MSSLKLVVARYWKESQLPSGNYLRVPMELLECGHSMREKSDIYGPTNAERRRCKDCSKSRADGKLEMGE